MKPPHKRPRRRPDRLLQADMANVAQAIASDYAAAPADRIANEMARKWGEDKLPELVGHLPHPKGGTLAEKFGAQVEAFERALNERPYNPEAVAAEARRMANAYRYLDGEAERIGAPRANPEAWEIEIGGQPAAILRDGAMYAAYAASNPGRRVYTLDEVARILALDSLALANACKDTFPGATVTGVRPRQSATAEALEDDIGF